MTDEKILRYAKRLKNDVAFEAVMDLLEQDALNEWKTSAPADIETRERAYNKQLSVHQIRQQVLIWADQAE